MKRQIKVLHISHSSVVATYQQKMKLLGQDPGLDITLLVPQHWSQANREIVLEKTGDPDYTIIARQPWDWGLRRPMHRNVLHIYPGLERLLTTLQPDIIDLWEEPFLAVTAQTLFWRKRVVPQAKVTFMTAQNIFKNYPLPFRWFEQMAFQQADYALPVCHEAEQVIRQKGYTGPSQVIPLGIELALYQSGEKDLSLSQQLNLDPGRAVVGYVGKFSPEKGIFTLLQAMRQLEDKTVQILMIGAGPAHDQILRTAHEYGLTNRLRLISGVPHGDVPRYYRLMDLLVVPSETTPSWKEQLGRVILEAMAGGVPVIGSDSGEIPHTIGDAGLIFPEKDTAVLVEHMQRCLADGDFRRAMIERGRQRVAEHFSWESVAARLRLIYHQLMSTRPVNQ